MDGRAWTVPIFKWLVAKELETSKLDQGGSKDPSPES